MARETWTDERLDDFGRHVDQRFDQLERTIDQRFDRVETQVQAVNARIDRVEGKFEEKFERIDARLDGIQRTMVQAMVVQTGGMLAGFIALFGLILTQT
jgi:hypothetical protein